LVVWRVVEVMATTVPAATAVKQCLGQMVWHLSSANDRLAAVNWLNKLFRASENYKDYRYGAIIMDLW
jgi:hypothetical protein